MSDVFGFFQNCTPSLQRGQADCSDGKETENMDGQMVVPLQFNTEIVWANMSKIGKVMFDTFIKPRYIHQRFSRRSYTSEHVHQAVSILWFSCWFGCDCDWLDDRVSESMNKLFNYSVALDAIVIGFVSVRIVGRCVVRQHVIVRKSYLMIPLIRNVWPQHHLHCRTTVIHITGCCPTRWRIPTSHCVSKVRIPSEHWAVWITAMTVGGKLSRASSSLADSSSHITLSSVFFCLALLDGIGALNSSGVDKGENTAFRRQQYITSSFQRTTL